MRSRLTSNRLVGRVGELAELRLAAREAASGQPALVLLGGDSGVGKTRLISELEAALRADDPDTLILHGEGVEPADGELPYAPLLSALRPLVRGRHASLDELSAGSRAQLGSLLPSLQGGELPPTREDGTGQVRLFEAMLELLDLAGERSPVALVLEDMHWADRSTRAFVAFLARSLRSERLFVLLSYRTDELYRRHPLRPLLAELERLERARLIRLEPFDREELGQALEDILGSSPGGALLERLFARAEGNPLFTEELLAVGLDGRGAAPQSLRDAFLVRIERLPDHAQRAARAVAVGYALPEAVISEATGLDPLTLQEALREAMAEQILIANGDGLLSFRHALLREALYDDLLPGERSDLHLRLARALEARIGQGSEGELIRSAAIAAHYAAAGDQPAALRTTIIAAESAEQARAYGEAADLLERALELWPRVPADARPADLDYVELLRRTATAHAMQSNRSRSEDLLQEALGHLDAQAEPSRYAALLAGLARAIWSLNRGPEAVALGERALEVLPEDDPDHLRPVLRGWLARTRFLRGRFRQAADDAEAALAEATAVGNTVAEAETLNTLGMARVALGDADAGIGYLTRAIEVARRVDDQDSMISAYSNLADMYNVIGQTRTALAIAREGLAQSSRRLVHAHNWMNLSVAEMAFEAGEWSEARAHLSPEPGRLTGVLLIVRYLRGIEQDLAMGDPEGARAALEAVEPLVCDSEEPQWIALYGVLRAALCRREGNLDGAQAAIADALDRLECCTDDVMRIARVSAGGIAVEADRAQRGRDLHDRAAVRDALTRARIHMDRLEAAATEGGAVERALLAEGRADLARAKDRATVRDWQRAADAWREIERPYPEARCRRHVAEIALMAGDRETACRIAGEVLTTAEQLGATWLIGELRALIERGRLPVGRDAGGDGVVAPAPAAAADPFGLTARERQVLALVAEGATNRQIGDALYMAEKTASVHVSRILAKLGVSGRTQAAAIAHRQHLT
ncbi:MAG TPA: AAA family ATPase [Solirubrobacteraceae bacterium]|nr:AAA family ATPase [Solirubrobacteraceae bacterium]